MARKIKIGLDYFPHSCDLDDDLLYIIALHKEIGYYVYFRLLEHIYFKNGYFCYWDKKHVALFSSKINVDINKVNDIINDLISEQLFDKLHHKKYNILTSKGIQVRYFEAIDRRKEADIIKDYILIDNDYINKSNVNIKWLNVNKSTQSKVEKSKEDKSIVIYSFEDFWNVYPNKIGKKDCEDKFSKLSNKELEKIKNTIDSFISYKPFESYNHPNPKTYLNQKRWEDELKTPASKDYTKPAKPELSHNANLGLDMDLKQRFYKGEITEEQAIKLQQEKN